MLSVPRVWVMPAPAVAKSETMVELAFTVVGYALIVELVAKSRVPPLKVIADPVVPKAEVEPKMTVPPETTMVAPVEEPALSKVNTPASCLVKEKFDPKAPSVRSVLAAVSKILDLKTVDPKVTPAIPLVTLLPTMILILAEVPNVSVPNVCVMPAPLVAKSEAIVAVSLVPTDVLYAAMLVFVAKSKMPPLRASELDEGPKAWVLAATRVPEVSVVVPVYVFVADKVNLSDAVDELYVNPPVLVLLITLAKVTLLPLVSMVMAEELPSIWLEMS